MQSHVLISYTLFLYQGSKIEHKEELIISVHSLKKRNKDLTLFRMGFLGAAHECGGEGGQKAPPLPKICHTYPTMMKLSTIILYLKKIKKYESRDTLFESC